MTLTRRSWLFVSGGRPEHFDKALASQADAVVFDLEDSIPAHAKVAARANVVEFLAERADSHVFVRVNPVHRDEGRDDLRALAALSIGGVRLPKIEESEDVRAAARLLNDREKLIQVTVESARGVRALRDIASEPAVGQICLGEGDLAADLGLGDRNWLMPIRMEAVVQSRAAGLPGPVQSPYPTISDVDGLAETTKIGRAMGFSGRSAIHPTQVEIINTLYQPTEAEVRRARETLRALDAATSKGHAAVAVDGRFVDLASVRDAQRVLAAYDAVSEATSTNTKEKHRR